MQATLNFMVHLEHCIVRTAGDARMHFVQLG